MAGFSIVPEMRNDIAALLHASIGLKQKCVVCAASSPIFAKPRTPKDYVIKSEQQNCQSQQYFKN